MKVVLSARVEGDIANQFQYGIETFGRKTAAQTFGRVNSFLHQLLPAHPRTGRWIANARLYEAWIAHTPFIVMYRIDDVAETITVLAMFHHAQDRSTFVADDPG